jgi:hypothetical protein
LVRKQPEPCGVCSRRGGAVAGSCPRRNAPPRPWHGHRDGGWPPRARQRDRCRGGARGHLAPGEVVHLGLPGVLEPDDEAYISGLARPEARETRQGQGGQACVAPSGRVELPMRAGVRPSRAAMGPHRRSTADRADCLPLKRRVVAGPRELLKTRVADFDGRGVDDGPLLHAAEGAWQVDRRGPRIRHRPLGQGFHSPVERLVVPPTRARRARDAWPLGRQGGAPEVCLISTARRPRRDDHGPPQHRQVQLALPLEHATRPAQAVHRTRRPQLLTPGTDPVAYIIRYPPSRSPVMGGLLLARSIGSSTRGDPVVKGGSVAVTSPIAFSRHAWGA